MTKEPSACREVFEKCWGNGTPSESDFINQMIKLVAKEWFENGWQAAIRDSNAELVEVLKSELAAHRAVYDAAKELNSLMQEVEDDEHGQNDRVFAHFEFDQLRYAFELVDNLKGQALARHSADKGEV